MVFFEFRGSLNNPFLNQTGRTGVFGKASATISAVSIALQISQTKIFSFVPTLQADYRSPCHVWVGNMGVGKRKRCQPAMMIERNMIYGVILDLFLDGLLLRTWQLWQQLVVFPNQWVIAPCHWSLGGCIDHAWKCKLNKLHQAKKVHFGERIYNAAPDEKQMSGCSGKNSSPPLILSWLP